jgi:hypothetical protein
MLCPLCGRRKVRRACPGVGHEICPICCGSKRLVEIACPPDCVYLATAREHPPAVAVRQRQHDLALLVRSMRDFTERQTELFLLTATTLARQEGSDLGRPIDDDAREAVSALAATLETSGRGVIYDHRPSSLPAERLVARLKPLLAKAGGNGGSAFERDAASVLRRLEAAVKDARAVEPENRRAFFDWLTRIMRQMRPAGARADEADAPRVIVP